jgi:predicted metal-dependent hydrolase
MVPYRLIRSRRKSVTLLITKDAALEVRAPLRISKKEIDRIVASKQSWINMHLGKAKEREANRTAFSLSYGDTVLLRGREYLIVARPGVKAGFAECGMCPGSGAADIGYMEPLDRLSGCGSDCTLNSAPDRAHIVLGNRGSTVLADRGFICLPPGLSPEEIKRSVIVVYRSAAKQLLTGRVAHYAKQMGVVPAAVRVTSARTRWGSCSSADSINFSWRIVMADDDVIDYVVVHELAHIVEHNHSDRFWRIVASVLPDYKQRRQRLKVLQQRLSNEDWG